MSDKYRDRESLRENWPRIARGALTFLAWSGFVQIVGNVLMLAGLTVTTLPSLVAMVVGAVLTWWLRREEQH